MSPKPEGLVTTLVTLKENGYTIIPVNLGMTNSWPQVVPIAQRYQRKIDVVDVFRRSEFVLPIAEDAMPLAPKPFGFKMVL